MAAARVRAMHARLEVARRELPRAVRIAVAATLAWWIARQLGADRPVFAVIVPLVAIRDDTHAALSLSLGRMLGVIAGVLLGIGVVAVAGVSTAAIALLLVIGLAAGLFLRTGPELNTQIAISALLVVIVTKNADDYALERIWETGVGSAVALAVAAFVLPPDPLGDAERRLAATAEALAEDLAGARGTLTSGDPSARVLLAHADEHARAAGRAVEDLPRAQRALRFSPLRRGTRPRLDVVDRRQRLALRLAIQVRRLARDFASFAHREDMRDAVGLGREAPAADHRAGRRSLGQGAGRRRLLARGRGRARAHGRLPARGLPPDHGDPPPPARAAAGRALRTAGVSAAVPAGEAAELARLRVIARRLGVAEDVRLLSPWTPLPSSGLEHASGAADLLLRSSPVPVLGVTGSAGKTTTARLAEAMLRASGVEALSSSDAPADNAWPTADLLERVLRARPPAWCVAELTSNHLAVCSASPQIACITNVWADHVDQHGSLEAYLEAKRRIVAFQATEDWTVVNADDPGAMELAAGSPARASCPARCGDRRATPAPASSPGA